MSNMICVTHINLSCFFCKRFWNVLTWVECRTAILNGIKNKLNLLWFIFELPLIIYFFAVTWFLFASTNAVHCRYGDWLCLKHPLWKKARMSANWIMLSIKFIKCHLMLKFSLQSKIWNNKIGRYFINYRKFITPFILFQLKYYSYCLILFTLALFPFSFYTS